MRRREVKSASGWRVTNRGIRVVGLAPLVEIRGIGDEAIEAEGNLILPFLLVVVIWNSRLLTIVRVFIHVLLFRRQNGRRWRWR